MEKPRHVYLHIPFCAHKCSYCDFTVFVWQGKEWVDRYLTALESEIDYALEGERAAIDTLFIGGGTPSLLKEKELERLFRILHAHFSLNEGAEFSLEANPGRLTQEKLRMIKDSGVNRLSIGVQTFEDRLLRRIGRDHLAVDALHAVDLASLAGFTNLSIDLMYGLPGQGLEDVKRDLQIVSRLPLTHLSAYNLIVEDRTRFGIEARKGILPLPDEETEVAMYDALTDELDRIGLKQYEISNFARPGFQSRHNRGYWLNHSYYGFGAGASGYVNRIRYENIAAVKPYIARAMKGTARQMQSLVSEKEEMEEMMFLGLRLMEGVSSQRFRERWGISLEQAYGDAIERLTKKGLLERDEAGIRLTRKGRFISNEVFSAFLREI